MIKRAISLDDNAKITKVFELHKKFFNYFSLFLHFFMTQPIKIKQDYTIDVATAQSRKSKKWKNQKMWWSELLQRCSDTVRTHETMAEYSRMSREQQGDIKDVGGFVGGCLAGGVRKGGSVRHRSIVTIDIDEGVPELWDDFTMEYDVAACVYSTHKHTAAKPRLRLLLLANRNILPEEYEAVSRYWAARIGIEYVDHTTHDLNRLFYWPSTSRDGIFYFDCQDGEPFDVDEVLSSYNDWRDASEWPVSSRERQAVAHTVRKAGDPLEKPGLIGAFCRAYTIEEAIDKFLPGIYEPTAHQGRYTYAGGSLAGGMLTYDGKYAYSHHNTDPAGGRLCNAFDLVRLHRFGISDEDSDTDDITRLPSYAKMQELAAADARVRSLMTRERAERCREDFAGIALPEGGNGAAAEDDDWTALLDFDRKGNIRQTIANIVCVLEHDPDIKGHIYLDQLRGQVSVEGGLPWDSGTDTWSNRDDANLRGWLEGKYDLKGKDKVKDALDMVITRHRRHPIREYFKELQWDGVQRLQRLVIDYLGADDTPLNRRLTEMHFVAAVARVMTPGCKYDLSLILAGPQGAGKSTLISIMGGKYYKDGLTTMEGKEAAEQLQGSHLIEIGELDAMRRSEVSAVKQFISCTTDKFRPAYGVRVETVPRQCVFFGTTNERYFLKDETGNRRFPIIPIKPELRKHGDEWFDDLRAERDQLWAEAYALWKQGYKIYLPERLEKEARERQQEYTDGSDDPMEGVLQTFLDTKLPPDWATWELARRRAWIRNPDPLSSTGTVLRDRVCAAEFICERMGRDMTDKEYKYIARKVGALLDKLGWTRLTSTRHAETLYGIQRGFKRPENDAPDGEII